MSAQTPFDALVSVEEQDAWAFVATGYEQEGPWVHQRTRIRALLAQTQRDNAIQRRLTDELRLSTAMRGSQG